MHWLPIQPRFALALIFALGLGTSLNAQLVITEVMSATRTNGTFRGPDYWELTNFGTNDLNLHGYSFRDSNPTHSPPKEPFTNLVIRAGESVIFFWLEKANQSVTTLAQFRAWWGESKLPANLQCRAWRTSWGLSGWDGDAVWLLDASSNVVDVAQFARARQGRAFSYDPETGFLGAFSVAGVDGAFAADMADDVGSPGVNIGPVPVRFLQQPIDQSADAETDVSFTVVAAGLPRPVYQWFAHGSPILNATNPTLVLSNIQPSDAGVYHAWMGNGMSAATSAVATLTVSTNPTPPTIVQPPADATVFGGQTAVFTVVARGVPAPRYQWQTNGVDIAGAVGATLAVTDVSEALSGLRYSVRIWNELGSTNSSALLTMTRRPDLRFTEVMALPANEEENRHFDWFELTNFETNALDLLGWRFSDHAAFARAVTITNALTLQPGESAVFAERLDARLFAAWWGDENLPEGLKLISYSGFGLEYLGDVLYVWTPAATDPYDYVASVSWAGATAGISFLCERSFCDPEGHCLDDSTSDNVLGARGAFRAINGGDIGSPGYVTNPPLRILAIARLANGEVRLQCRVSVGKTYRLGRTPSLWAPNWTALPASIATNNVMTLSDTISETAPAWFYRVEELP